MHMAAGGKRSFSIFQRRFERFWLSRKKCVSKEVHQSANIVWRAELDFFQKVRFRLVEKRFENANGQKLTMGRF